MAEQWPNGLAWWAGNGWVGRAENTAMTKICAVTKECKLMILSTRHSTTEKRVNLTVSPNSTSWLCLLEKNIKLTQN